MIFKRRTIKRVGEPKEFYTMQIPIPSGYELCDGEDDGAIKIKHDRLGLPPKEAYVTFYVKLNRPRSKRGEKFYSLKRGKIVEREEEVPPKPLLPWLEEPPLAEKLYQEGNYYMTKTLAAKALLAAIELKEQ